MVTLSGIVTVSESDTSPAAIASEASSPVIIFVVLAGAQSRSGFLAPSTLAGRAINDDRRPRRHRRQRLLGHSASPAVVRGVGAPP